MKKLFYSLVLFASLFFCLNCVNAEYKLENNEVELLKCNYGTSNGIVFSLIKTSKRLIVDSPAFCSSSTVAEDLKYEDVDETAGSYGCPKILYISSDNADNCKMSNKTTSQLYYYHYSTEVGENGEPATEKNCGVTINLNLKFDVEVKLIAKKKYGNYYYKLLGYNLDSGDIPFSDEYVFTYNDESVTFKLSKESANLLKNHLENSSSDVCPSDFRICKRVSDVYSELETDVEFNISQEAYCPTIYSDYLGGLKNPLSNISEKPLSWSLILNDEDITLNDINANNSICEKNNCPDAVSKTEQSLKEIRSYCNDIYMTYVDKNHEWSVSMKNECIAFDKFYNRLVSEGFIQDQTTGCDFVTDDLQEKLIWVLDIIKIAGPILALGLGTLDFIKVLASGDADKEMKTAFKRFSIRIVAAILLFIIPVILAFLMDIFIGNQNGYNSDNPFCNVVEWE